MKNLNNLISQQRSYKLSYEDKKKLIALDKEYGDCVISYRRDWNTKDVLNMETEFEKFNNARQRGEKYYPYIKLHENKFKEVNLLPRLKNLLLEFEKFNCYISRYYIELLRSMIAKVECSFDMKNNYYKYTQLQWKNISNDLYKLALKTIKEHPYEEVNENDRNITGEQAQKIIQDFIDELGYKYKVLLNDEIIPRMNVDIDGTMNIKTSATFSATDIEGLKEHEVKGHIGRRYYGYQRGLWLMVMGLDGRNTLDEGLAIYNSLNNVKKIKPNVMFNIALKTVICYHLKDMDFCELFDFCKKLDKNIPNLTLFKTLCRFKRELQDCSFKGGNADDMSYFCGYQIVKNLSDAERDDILKYNIGPDQMKDIEIIKKFFNDNEFEPIKIIPLK